MTGTRARSAIGRWRDPTQRSRRRSLRNWLFTSSSGCMGKTSAIQLLSRPPLWTGTQLTDRVASDREIRRTTRRRAAEADQARALSDELRPPASVPVPGSLARHNAHDWRSSWAYVGVHLSDVVDVDRVLSEHLATYQPIDRNGEVVRRLGRARPRCSAIRACLHDGDGW